MEAGGSKSSSSKGPPCPDCTCCWPREAFNSAASLLREIEDLCTSNIQEGDSAAGAERVPQGTNRATEEQELQQQQQRQEQDGSVSLPVCTSLVWEALELLVDVLRCVS